MTQYPKAALALVALLFSATANASYVPFSGAGTSGTIATLPGSVPWIYSGGMAWSIPGVIAGPVSWSGASRETEFSVTFTGVPSNVVISPTASVFHDTSDNTNWVTTISADGHTVLFVAPTGTSLDSGDVFYVNVIFTGAVGQAVNFAGSFDPQLVGRAALAVRAVPEPPMVTLLFIAGALGLAFLRRRRRPAAARPS